MKYNLIFVLLYLLMIMPSCKENEQGNDDADEDGSQIQLLEDWLATPPNNRESLNALDFAKQSLTKSQAEAATALILADKQARILDTYGDQWDQRLLKFDEFKMPFYYKVFGVEPADGRSLFISMHGGGGAPAEVNDQQYKNQQNLYDSVMNALEGVYLAPRAPSDSWDLWHQEHIDEFINILIQLAVIKENVNPNKVYLLGYSAGGDGVFQLAPRMADRFAAASMMAGHPNETSPLGLKTLPFALHMGELDEAYDRNLRAKQWKTMLDSLENAAPGTYIHQVVLHEGLGHWMKLRDAVALPWMQNYKRNPVPESLFWKQDNRHHRNFYWLGIPERLIVTGGELKAAYNKSENQINITENYSDTIHLFVNDKMMDLDNPVTIKYKGEVIFKEVLDRSILNIYNTLMYKGDAHLSFPSMVSVVKNSKVIKKAYSHTVATQ